MDAGDRARDRAPKFADSTEFVKWLPQARGKIVMLSPAWPTCRPSEDWFRWSTPESMARMDTLVARDAARLGGESGQQQALSRHGLLAGARHRHARHASREGRRRRDDHVAHEILRLSEPVSRGGQRARPRRIRRTRHAWAGERSRRRRAGASVTAGGTEPAGGGDVAVAAEVAAARARPGAAAGGRSRSSRPTTRSRRPSTLTCEDYGLLFRLAENNQKPVRAARPRRASCSANCRCSTPSA